MPNAELFAKIRDAIKANPEQHDQGVFEGVRDACGTTRCVAGWAIYLETGAPLFASRLGATLTPEVKALAERLGVVDDDLDDIDMIPVIARELLGLDRWQARQLFYRFSNRAALELVESYAEGE